jgi:hypothetical protein
MLLGIVTLSYWVALLSILILPCAVYLYTPSVLPPKTMSNRIQQYVGADRSVLLDVSIKT